MIKFYPSFSNVMKDFTTLAGNQTGILKSTAVPLVNHDNEACLKSITGNMPNYHKQVLNSNTSVQYHIIGYGSHYEEALIKYTGESIERYATMVCSELLKDKIVYATYKEILKKGKVMPLKYMDVFTKEQIKENKKLNMTMCDKKVTEEDIIGWIKCPSLLNSKEEIWVPAKMMFVGYNVSHEKRELNYIPSFSTGTAAHKSLKKALLNALIEYIQIDAFMISWYTKRKCSLVKIDNEYVNKVLEDVNLGENSPYEIIPLYMTLEEIPIPTFGVFLKRKDKKTPYMLFGVQGGLNAENALTRGIMEAAAISYSSYFNTIYNKESLEYVIGENPKFLDLDTNVLFYSIPTKTEQKDKLIQDFVDDEVNLSSIEDFRGEGIDSQIRCLIKYISKVSKYAVYMDITPPEAREKGWYVMRVLIPELLEMCIPEFPFANHPRMKKYGGIKNEYPHPMP
ncbi:YcaO-like family protein [Haloimpatiens sp. FM7330]|uniref:YcaO-like family protein n=1 Tax=Haloimpatiens sp. FM7330 TaxID=3298610 RepID=UPI003636DC26